MTRVTALLGEMYLMIHWLLHLGDSLMAIA